MFEKTSRYWNTLKHLTPQQVIYRAYYTVRQNSLFRFPSVNNKTAHIAVRLLSLDESILYSSRYTNGAFIFLNRTKEFQSIDWNFPDYGKLWTYNLNYFDFLNQMEINENEALTLILDYISRFSNLRDGIEPYPTSCRIINWIKYLSRSGYQDDRINKNLYLSARILMGKLEYHLMGNHLLQNAFALLFVAHYFNDYVLYRKSRTLLLAQLKEQILSDGGHFELSPMYHQEILFRILDCVNLLKNNKGIEDDLLQIITSIAVKMLAWVREMTFSDGTIPLFNDSAFGIAPTTTQLEEYALTLGIAQLPLHITLKESGYRMIRKPEYEMAIDIGNIGPDYIPGHAHSDTFNFELHIGDSPFITDTGTSTYEPGSVRLSQRSTSAHNTVQIGDYEQSEVWESHRVARRAKITAIKEVDNEIIATHDGYRRIGAFHTRAFKTKPKRIVIDDTVDSMKSLPCRSYIHFHPDVRPIFQENIIKTNMGRISFTGAKKITLTDYDYAPEFNRLLPSKMAIIDFTQHLVTEICL